MVKVMSQFTVTVAKSALGLSFEVKTLRPVAMIFRRDHCMSV